MFAMAFRRYWIENYVTRDIKNLSVISVKGDSMEGVLNDGDTILINHGQTTPRDGLYVLRLNENLWSNACTDTRRHRQRHFRQRSLPYF